MGKYGLQGDQQNEAVAVQAMDVRIELAQSKCPECDATDLYIVAAIAQNGGEFDDAIKNFIDKGTGKLKKNALFNQPSNPSQPDAIVRQKILGQNLID